MGVTLVSLHTCRIKWLFVLLCTHCTCAVAIVDSLSLSLSPAPSHSLSPLSPSPISSASATVHSTDMQLPTMQYNLHLLKAMLECNSTAEGKVDQPTYSHIIRMWVKDVRDRTEKAAAPEPTLEVHRFTCSWLCVSLIFRPILSFSMPDRGWRYLHSVMLTHIHTHINLSLVLCAYLSPCVHCVIDNTVCTVWSIDIKEGSTCCSVSR